MAEIQAVSIPTADGSIPGGLAVPAGAGHWPGVVVVHATDDAYRRVFAFFGEHPGS